jgi:hypothetical protein
VTGFYEFPNKGYGYYPDILTSNKKMDPFLLICNNAPELSTPGIWYDRSGYDMIGLDILILYVSSQQISGN